MAQSVGAPASKSGVREFKSPALATSQSCFEVATNSLVTVLYIRPIYDFKPS